jgi:hypothetical protein
LEELREKNLSDSNGIKKFRPPSPCNGRRRLCRICGYVEKRGLHNYVGRSEWRSPPTPDKRSAFNAQFIVPELEAPETGFS